MQRIQTQGVHHITLVGANRQTSIDFWQGVLGMPFVFEQPNLDDPDQNHLYFDPGDGRLITIFTSESWKPDRTPNPNGIGNVHHLAFAVSRATYTLAAERLKDRGFPIGYCVTATTRPSRPTEINGVHYFFVSDAEFDAMLEGGELIEHAVNHGKRYGIPYAGLRTGLRRGPDVLVTPDER